MVGDVASLLCGKGGSLGGPWCVQRDPEEVASVAASVMHDGGGLGCSLAGEWWQETASMAAEETASIGGSCLSSSSMTCDGKVDAVVDVRRQRARRPRACLGSHLVLAISNFWAS